MPKAKPKDPTQLNDPTVSTEYLGSIKAHSRGTDKTVFVISDPILGLFHLCHLSPPF